jgi:hypothetical protein
MSHTTNRTFICSVVFLDIVGYSQKLVDEQILLKSRFNDILAEAIKDVAANDRIILDTGDGAAISFMGDPEDALFVALSIRDAIVNEEGSLTPHLSVCIGINLGPVKLIQDINGQRNMIGDGINVAQRVMAFAIPGQILVSRSYFEVISRLSQEYAQLFHYEGSRADKHVREHQVYSVYPVEKKNVSSSASLVQRMEEQRKEMTGGAVSTKATDKASGGQSGKTVDVEEDLHIRTSRRISWKIPWRAGWEKISGHWRIMGLGLKNRLGNCNAKGFDWHAIRHNRTMLYVAAALLVILIGVPVIVWKAGGTPGEKPGRVQSESYVTMQEAIKQLETPAATSSSDTPKKAEMAKTIDKPVGTATVSLGISPWGEVYVDGNKVGVSPPLNSIEVALGKHQIEIRNTTFSPYRQTVDVQPGEQLKIKHKFR